MGTHLRVLSESFPMNTNMTGLRWFSKKKIFVLWTKVATALEGLISLYVISVGISVVFTMRDFTVFYETTLHNSEVKPCFCFFSRNLEKKAKDGSTALHLCAQHNQTECMKLLLRLSPELVEIENANNQTAMDIAREMGHESCVELVSFSSFQTKIFNVVCMYNCINPIYAGYGLSGNLSFYWG